MKKISLFVATLFLALSANALTLKEKKQFESWNNDLSKSSGYGELMKQTCGFTAPLKIEEAFVTPFMEANTSASSYCDSVRGALRMMCKDTTSKAEITKKIKTVTCKLGKEKEASFKLNGTDLVFTVGLGASNLDQKAVEWLENNL